MLNEPGPINPKTPNQSLGLDLFGEPILDADEAGEQPGVNQDHGLSLNDDELEAIEAVWEERTRVKEPAPEPTAGQRLPGVK